MDLVRHLRYFLVVAEELHFGRAAARLFMAQPPLSQRVRRLEQEYGTPLFDRSGGRVRLTPAGEALYREAAGIVASVDRARLLVQRAAGNGSGRLRVGVPPQTSGRALAALAAAVGRVLPEVSLDMVEETTARQVALLTSGDLDVGLVQHPVEATGLRYGSRVTIAQGVVLPRLSPLAERTEIALVELAGHDLVMYPRSAAPSGYDETLEICRRHGFDPVRVRHAGSPEFLVGLVAAGLGVAFDHGTIAQKEPRVVWRPLSGEPLSCRMSAAWPIDGAHPAAARFAGIAARVLAGEGFREPESLGPPSTEYDSPRPWAVVFRPRTRAAPGRGRTVTGRSGSQPIDGPAGRPTNSCFDIRPPPGRPGGEHRRRIPPPVRVGEHADLVADTQHRTRLGGHRNVLVEGGGQPLPRCAGDSRPGQGREHLRERRRIGRTDVVEQRLEQLPRPTGDACMTQPEFAGQRLDIVQTHPPEQQVGRRVVAQHHGEQGQVAPAHVDVVATRGRAHAAQLILLAHPYPLGHVDLAQRGLPGELQYQ
ncbi:MAG: hypothetical protein AUI14_06570 [Actinobacteria bacterium 13_2_20CM_2_71_6]|nr:MAG: hypothetical protein AUI14_06570 [Actinobacteria bacterium 13_2_20CM_2_71_6]